MDIDGNIVAVTLHNGDKLGGDNDELSKHLPPRASLPAQPANEPPRLPRHPGEAHPAQGRG